MLPAVAITQESRLYNYYYRVYFKDKGPVTASGFEANQLLSERAIARREKSNIPVPSDNDLPVFRDYLNHITLLGLNLHCTSRWLNTGLFGTDQPADESSILSLPFVRQVKLVRNPSAKGTASGKLDFAVTDSKTMAYEWQISMLNANSLYYTGFNGKGVLIAILDGGFLGADMLSSLGSLRERNGILATYDFVSLDKNAYVSHDHGTAVLSVLAGELSSGLRGSATGADYLLLRTEDADREFPLEEDLWAAGAEYADSAGADIISTSLGYFVFEDPSMNYTFKNMDGNTTFVTRAADIAASKGILVVASAGNERNKEWQRIIAPADGDSVLAVGAVNDAGDISSFSSAGPSSDRRIKPDICAMGVGVTVQTNPYSTGRASGTSFSCPLVSGMAACLKQAVPEASAADILSVIQRSADRYLLPDSLYGFGIPDAELALLYLQDKYLISPEKGSRAWPNPTSGSIQVAFREDPGSIILEILTLTGSLVSKRYYPDYPGRSLMISDLQNARSGIYFIRIRTAKEVFQHKIIKTGNLQ
jgi:subtilisin family serine protease